MKYGAVPDSVTDCTSAFRSAIAACTKAGGGRVVVEGGTYLTGAIHLARHVNLHVAVKAITCARRSFSHIVARTCSSRA